MGPLLRKNDAISALLSEEFLEDGIIFFIIGIVILVSFIYFFLYKKKRRYLLQTSVKKSFELWISKAILEEYDDEATSAFHIPEKFIQHFKNKEKRNYALTELLNSKKNLTGAAAENIVKLYLQLDLKRYSVRKFTSKQWHIKAQGIQELYVMEQADMLTRIYKHTNSSNEFVRMEAQTGVIHFSGFEGLRFLEVLTYPMSEWQQIKLLEQLRTIDLVEMIRLPRWLRSENDTVVIFALKLVEEYQQYQVHEEVQQCLQHANEKLRYQAIRSIVRIANESTPSILAAQYTNETFSNKMLILQLMKNIAGKEELPFFQQVLNEEDDTLKLNAARSIAFIDDSGLEILEQKAAVQEYPYLPIYLHIKAEMHS